jgi:hypothetical protein
MEPPEDIERMRKKKKDEEEKAGRSPPRMDEEEEKVVPPAPPPNLRGALGYVSNLANAGGNVNVGGGLVTPPTKHGGGISHESTGEKAKVAKDIDKSPIKFTPERMQEIKELIEDDLLTDKTFADQGAMVTGRFPVRMDAYDDKGNYVLRNERNPILDKLNIVYSKNDRGGMIAYDYINKHWLRRGDGEEKKNSHSII